MTPPSRQLESVIEAFGRQGWHCERVEGREVVTTAFEAHHTHLHLHAQVFPQIEGLSIVGETPLQVPASHRASVLEFLMRASSQLTLGAFEYDFERQQLIFRITNLFSREVYDADLISTMVHCTVAELDRLVPLLGVILTTAPDLLADLSLPLLLEREDLLPPVPGGGEEEEL